MSLTVTGTVVDENGTGLGGLLVEARGDWLLTSEVVDSTTTRNTGDFTLVLAGMLGEPTHPSSCRHPRRRRHRPADQRRQGRPGTDGNQAVGRITVRTADRTGLLVTNGKGEARMVSEGNAMTILIDGKEAFGSAADDMEAATTSLNMTQLFFTTPDYKLAPADEHPKLVFSFGPPTIVPLDPLPSGQEPTPVPDRRTAARSASCWTRLAARSRCASCSTSRSPAGRRERSGSRPCRRPWPVSGPGRSVWWR